MAWKYHPNNKDPEKEPYDTPKKCFGPMELQYKLRKSENELCIAAISPALTLDGLSKKLDQALAELVMDSQDGRYIFEDKEDYTLKDKDGNLVSEGKVYVLVIYERDRNFQVREIGRLKLIEK